MIYGSMASIIKGSDRTWNQTCLPKKNWLPLFLKEKDEAIKYFVGQLLLHLVIVHLC